MSWIVGTIAQCRSSVTEQERSALRVAVQEFAHFAEHSLQVDADELSRSASRCSAVLSHGNCSNHVGATARSRDGTPRYHCDTAPRALRVRVVRLATRSAARSGHARRRCRRVPQQNARSAWSCRSRARPRSSDTRLRGSCGPRRPKVREHLRSADQRARGDVRDTPEPDDAVGEARRTCCCEAPKTGCPGGDSSSATGSQ